MKKITLTLVAILFAVTGITAQTPNEFKYQAVLRNTDGTIMANEAVTVDISILQSTATGTSVFDETHNVTTTAQGLINLNIGSVEDLSVIDWLSDAYFIEVSVNGIRMGTSQLLSVPYALTAKTVENDQVNDADADPTNEIQDLNLTGNTLKITNNASAANIDLSPYLDNTDDQNLANVLTQGTDAGNKKITNLADPTNEQDAVTKAYLDHKFDMLSIANQGVTDYDGNHYNAVVIGNQIWMSENLKVTHYPDGTAIPFITGNTDWANLGDNDTDDAYCYYNNNASGEKDIYGALYTWAAAMGDNAVSSSTNPSGVQGVCPTGWHLPSDAEWTELTDYLGGTSVDGGKMKETGTTHWNSPNTGATNETGFSALPGGYRYSFDGTFYDVGNLGKWWSATEGSSSTAWLRYLDYDNAEASRYYGYKSYGFSVRCVRD